MGFPYGLSIDDCPLRNVCAAHPLHTGTNCSCNYIVHVFAMCDQWMVVWACDVRGSAARGVGFLCLVFRVFVFQVQRREGGFRSESSFT